MDAQADQTQSHALRNQPVTAYAGWLRIHSPDEARNEEGLPIVPNGAGKEPRVQQQVVPLSFCAKPPEVPAPALPAPTEEPDLPDDAAKAVAESEFRKMLAA